MVLTLQFDKNLLRYITFNLQRLFRTVLVLFFNKQKQKTFTAFFYLLFLFLKFRGHMTLNKSFLMERMFKGVF